MPIDRFVDHWLFQVAMAVVFALWILMLMTKRFLATHGLTVGWQDARAQLRALRSLTESGQDVAERARLLRRVLQIGMALWLAVASLLLAIFLGLIEL